MDHFAVAAQTAEGYRDVLVKFYGHLKIHAENSVIAARPPRDMMSIYLEVKSLERKVTTSFSLVMIIIYPILLKGIGSEKYIFFLHQPKGINHVCMYVCTGMYVQYVCMLVCVCVCSPSEQTG